MTLAANPDGVYDYIHAVFDITGMPSRPQKLQKSSTLIGCLVLGLSVYVILAIFIAMEIGIKLHNFSSESANYTSHRVLLYVQRMKVTLL